MASDRRFEDPAEPAGVEDTWRVGALDGLVPHPDFLVVENARDTVSERLIGIFARRGRRTGADAHIYTN